MQSKMKPDLQTDALCLMGKFVEGISHLEDKTRQGYRKAILSFITFLEEGSTGKPFPQAIKQETIVGWLKKVTEIHSTDTVLPQARIVARFLSFLESSGVLQQNPLGVLQRQYPKQGLTAIVLALLSVSPNESLEALTSAPPFTSPLGVCMQKFIALGRAQGKVYRVEEETLCCFDRFLQSLQPPPHHLSDTVMRKWLALYSSAQPGTRYINFGIVRRFCFYLRRFDPSAYVPHQSLAPPPPPPFLPYIYSRSEIVALLKAARQLKPSALSPIRPQAFYLLIALLYTTGMRLSEVLKLELRDIDWKQQALHIRKTKFFKSRHLPLSTSMMKQLESYLQLRKGSGAPSTPVSPLLQNPHRLGPYSKSVVRTTFHQLLQRAGVTWAQDRSRPRIHDLRHSMAVHRLEDWYRQGADVQSNLRLLSTYLGHANLAGTKTYLTMTTELLQLASQRFQRFYTVKSSAEGDYQ